MRKYRSSIVDCAVTHKVIWVLLIILLNSSLASAQRSEWDSLTRKFAEHRNNTLQEKIFAHLDRTFYVAGESMWFKIYCVDGYLHRPLDVSKVAYLEILDKESKAVLQTKVSLREGEGNGQLLLPFSLGSGNYLVRVYTAWMKNFSSEFYFQQPITIVNTIRKTELPIQNNSPQYDIQFFPEGGHLVDGIRSTVAFRIVNQLGKGENISGAILNQRGDTVTSFRPLKFGIGNFTFLPSASEKYKVVIKSKSASIITKFPDIQTTGYVLHLTDTTNNQVKVTVQSKETGTSVYAIYLLVHTRQVVKVAQIKTKPTTTTIFLLDKNNLGEGISHITIFNEDRKPVCERLYFKRPNEKLAITVQPDEKKYNARKKIRLDVNVSTSAFKSGSFSMSVFKDDSLNQFSPLDIQHYEFLTSDLKGNIESPAYYFSEDLLVDQATDNLMLTHGWSRFKWDDILTKQTSPILFGPEYRGHVISGNMIDTRTGSNTSGIHTYLSTPGKDIKLYGSLSDANGYVQFEMGNFFDKKKIFIQPNLNQDSIYQIKINNPYSENFSSFSLPPLSFSSAWKDQLIARSISMQTGNTYKNAKKNTLKNPSIDSSAFYGEPDEKYLLDDYTRFTVMEEVMREYVHGVWVRKKDGKFIFKVPDEPRHGLFQNESLVLLDGVPIFDVDKIMAFSPLKVQKLDVMTRKYFLGPFAFEGIVSYTTYKGDLGGFEIDPKVTVLDYQGLQLQKEFFSPQYETPSQLESRLADRRNLLFWTPNINLSGKENQTIEFYSSDEPGIYKIMIQGMSSTGITGSTSASFEVTALEK